MIDVLQYLCISYNADQLKCTINHCVATGLPHMSETLPPMQPPPAENSIIAKDKKKILVECALFIASHLQWNLATLKR